METDTARTEIKNDPLRELVLSAQGGDREAMAALWDGVERFVRWEANRRYTLTGTIGGADIDDLCQCGYLALVDAVGRYDPQKANGSFLGLLSFRLRTAFSEAQGIRGHRDPLNRAASLDEPLSDCLHDDSEQTRADFIEDPAAADAFTAAEDRIFKDQLSKAIFRALDALPAERRQVVKDRFYRKLTLAEIARERGVTANAIREAEGTALRQMRMQAWKYGLDRFIEQQTRFYRPAGYGAFANADYTSSTELTVFEREQLRRQHREADTEASRTRQYERF